MTDHNGKEIKIGAKAVVLKGVNKGCIGEVRDIRRFHFLPKGCGSHGVRVAAGPAVDPEFSSWCQPKDIAVV